MEQYKISESYYYVKYQSDIEMFEALNKYLESGFIITDSIYLSVEVTKDNISYLLSYTEIEINENIKDNLRKLYKNYEISYPDYSNCMLNIISAIRKNYGYPHSYESCDYLFDKQYKNVVILLLDGLGLDVLNYNLDEKSFLRKNIIHINSAIYPSTTAASTTSTKCGLSPLSSGWTGWENYLREADRNLVLFNGRNYVTDEVTGISLYDYIPYDMFYHDMDVDGIVIEPDFTNHKHKIKELYKKNLNAFKK